MLRYLITATLLAASIALSSFLIGAQSPPVPSPVLAGVLFLCPSYAFFAATAACDPFDSCSLDMLRSVVTLNVITYCVLAAVLWYTRQRMKLLRLVVFAVAGGASAWWALQWT